MSPMRREAYPPDWEQISLSIRERAGWKCEKCGAPNGEYIQRLRTDPAQWTLFDDLLNSVPTSEYDDSAYYPPVRVILTVHHVGVPYPDGTPGDPHDKLDCRPENLQALCQRCHLLADLPLHIANAHRTRRQRKLDAGQIEMFPEAKS